MRLQRLARGKALESKANTYAFISGSNGLFRGQRPQEDLAFSEPGTLLYVGFVAW